MPSVAHNIKSSRKQRPVVCESKRTFALYFETDSVFEWMRLAVSTEFDGLTTIKKNDVREFHNLIEEIDSTTKNQNEQMITTIVCSYCIR